MSRSLKDKIVVITGGLGSIGFEIADKFLEKGAKVAILLDINEKKSTGAVKALIARHGDDKANFIKCDVTTDLEDITKRIIDKYTYIDVLVNTANIKSGFKTNDGFDRKSIEINVTASILWTTKFWEIMRIDKGGKGGTIINLSSVVGPRPGPFSPVYEASKFGILGFTKSMGNKYSFEKCAVTVMAMCPIDYSVNSDVSLPPFSEKKSASAVEYATIQSELQKAEDVGRAAVELFEKAESGSAWLTRGANLLSQFKWSTLSFSP